MRVRASECVRVCHLENSKPSHVKTVLLLRCARFPVLRRGNIVAMTMCHESSGLVSAPRTAPRREQKADLHRLM